MVSASHSFFDDYIDEVTKLETFVKLTLHGFDFAKNASRVIELVERNQNIKERRLSEATKLEDFANEQQSNGFSYLYTVAIIRLWSILEASIDDLVIDILLNQRFKTDEHIKKVKGNLYEFVNLSELDRAEFILESLKTDIKARQKLGIGRFESLLETVGYEGGIPDIVRKNILEFSQIRNAIMHKNGKVDSRLLKLCPWIKSKLNDEILLTHLDFLTYQLTTYWYFLDLSIRYEPKQPDIDQVIEVHKDLLNWLQTNSNRI
ncbi:hypothetical protein [Paenibacillus cellulositrophicus]|uniref:hypothetical protein n=1 Tax=Paenibacillus cellulositrophicus TaxID=562959 RepID=UPI003D997F54